MIDSSRPSAIRVFGKSMYVFAAGWLIAVAWLWGAGLYQQIYRHGTPPPNYAAGLAIIGGVIPSFFIFLCGKIIGRLAGRAPETRLERREWWHAFWWAFVPNAQLFATVWIMIREGY